jgi:hypothetical protein
MSYELEFMGDDYITVDTGYGEYGADLIVEVEPVYEDLRFDAHGPGGTLQTYGDANALVGVNVLGATAFVIGNNGVELGEMELDEEDLKKHGIDEEVLLEKLERILG